VKNMKELFDLVKKLRDRIERYGDLLRGNEALTRYVLIDPVLRALGWDTENPDIVRPEERQEGGRPDYILYHNGMKLIALEAKSLGTRLDEKKVLDLGFNYSWKNRIPYFIITDGNVWKIYDVRKMGGNLILEINVVGEPIEDVIRKFFSLWRPLVKHEIKSVEMIVESKRYLSKEVEAQVKIRYNEKKVFKGPIKSKFAELLVLHVLYKSGRPMRRKEIVEKISEIVELTEYDREVLRSGRVRWKATVRWAISNLGKRGLIERVEEGIWKITKLGISKLKELER